jgi:hypothetical protein
MVSYSMASWLCPVFLNKQIRPYLTNQKVSDVTPLGGRFQSLQLQIMVKVLIDVDCYGYVTYSTLRIPSSSINIMVTTISVAFNG